MVFLPKLSQFTAKVSDEIDKLLEESHLIRKENSKATKQCLALLKSGEPDKDKCKELEDVHG